MKRQVPSKPGQWTATTEVSPASRSLWLGKTVDEEGMLRVRGIRDWRGVLLPNGMYPADPPMLYSIHEQDYVISEEEAIRQLLAGGGE